MIKVALAFIGILAVSILVFLFFFFETADAPKTDQTSSQNQQSTNEQTKQADPDSFDKSRYSLKDPGSIWVVVNKKRSISTSYVPEELINPDVALMTSGTAEQQLIRSDVAVYVKALFNAAKKDNVNLVFGSGYRSANLQSSLYNQYVSVNGQQQADTFSARPGHSEHQTGLAFDVTSPSGQCFLEICFADTAEGKWVAKNAHKYGFIVRYPNGKDLVTGYQFEPWHLRFVGKDLAKEIYSSGKTLEEFFELGSAPTY